MSRPRLARDVNVLPGLVALALFVVLALAFTSAGVGEPVGSFDQVRIVNETAVTDDAAASVTTQTVGEDLNVVAVSDGSEVANFSYAEPGDNVTFFTQGGTTFARHSTDVGITSNIGFALFGLNGLMSESSETFLVVFEIIDVVLVAALVGAIMLARRDETETPVADGGTATADDTTGSTGDATGAPGDAGTAGGTGDGSGGERSW